MSESEYERVSLPPGVKGEVRGELWLHVAEVRVASPPAGVQSLAPKHVVVKWWGERGDGAKRSEASRPLVYALRSSPKRLAAYLRDMGPLVIALYGPHHVVVASAQKRLDSVRPRRHYVWNLPLLSPQGTKLGVMRLALRLQPPGASRAPDLPQGFARGNSASPPKADLAAHPSPAKSPQAFIDPALVVESPEHPGQLFRRDLELEALDDEIEALEAANNSATESEAESSDNEGLDDDANGGGSSPAHRGIPGAVDAVMIPIQLVPNESPPLPQAQVSRGARAKTGACQASAPVAANVDDAASRHKAEQAKVLLDDLWQRGHQLKARLASAMARPTAAALDNELVAAIGTAAGEPESNNEGTGWPSQASEAVDAFPLVDAVAQLNTSGISETESNLAEEDALLEELFFAKDDDGEDDGEESSNNGDADSTALAAQPMPPPAPLLYTLVRLGRVTNLDLASGGWGEDAPPSLYLACKLFRRDDSVATRVAYGERAPNFDFEHTVPVAVTPMFLTYLKNSSLIVEVWHRPVRESGHDGGEMVRPKDDDVLVGLVKLPFHQFFVSFRDELSRGAFLGERLPVCAANEAYPIVDMRTGATRGSLECVLAMGMLPQIRTLQARIRTVSGAPSSLVPLAALETSLNSGDIEWATPAKAQMVSGPSRRSDETAAIIGSSGSGVDGSVDHHVFEVAIESAASLRWLNLAAPGSGETGDPQFYVQYEFPGTEGKVATSAMICAPSVKIGHKATCSVLKPASAPWSVFLPRNGVDAITFTLKQPTLRGQDAVLGRAILPAEDFLGLVDEVGVDEPVRGAFTLAIVPSGDRPGFMGYLKIVLHAAPRVSRALLPAAGDKLRTEIELHVSDVVGPGAVTPGELEARLELAGGSGPNSSVRWGHDEAVEGRTATLVGADTLEALTTNGAVLIEDSVLGNVRLPLRAFLVGWTEESHAPGSVSGWLPLQRAGRAGGMVHATLRMRLAAPVRSDPLLRAGGRLPAEVGAKLTLLVDELELFEESASGGYFVTYQPHGTLPQTQSKTYSAEPGAAVVPMRHRSVFHDLGPALLERMLAAPMAVEVWRSGGDDGAEHVGTAWLWLWELMDRFVGAPRVTDEPAWVNASFLCPAWQRAR
ncbi:uncharacterized protein AMSG_04743 [Thecamonas trahens ATCC 50062]|uniref:C2CD3 N-terminal C2 domain-containing protein n=1 Tax=Thecamonas trahens ATCC 50062 TaxID=461836 RepID=A0A0L0D9I3_THETB|nr:hypothetical protein AMSG_04743 [Thecamonas trahens ATCC 50062]KNC48999.1 hypothetical protein AMSG_04743 [Thecamonas trahens ATCC 50062]|eukprot:XP_013758412.1 hypothetical protein AMSG_04743 [Thecamonas trahens ATCC 50062]